MNLRFCGQPGSRSDFGTKSDEFLGLLGWLITWFRGGRVVKITFPLKLEFFDLGLHFGVHFGAGNGTKVHMWFTLGSQRCQLEALGAGLDFRGAPKSHIHLGLKVIRSQLRP